MVDRENLGRVNQLYDEREQIVDPDGLVVAGRGRDGDDLLSEDVERVAGDHRGLNRRLAQPSGNDRALEQVGTELGKDPTPADVADRMAGPADAL